VASDVPVAPHDLTGWLWSRTDAVEGSTGRGVDGGQAVTPADHTDLFLSQRREWMNRALFSGLPAVPTTGDRGPVKDAIADIVDAAAGLEYSRIQLHRAIVIAQAEFDAARRGLPDLERASAWGGKNTPAVYYEFYNAVAWTRAVKDRYGEVLRDAVKHDPALWTTLQKIRSGATRELEDARLLAKCSLHKFTPPYPLAGPKIADDGSLIWRVPEIVDADDFRANLGTLMDSRHVVSIVEGFWLAVSRLVEAILDTFYPRSP